MDVERIECFLMRAAAPLGLDGPLPPWDLLAARAPLPVWRDPVLAPPCPLPFDLEPDVILRAFDDAERDAIARQIDAAFERVMFASDGQTNPPEPVSVVRVQCGVPIIGNTRALLRIRTANVYGDDARRVTGDFHAWLTPEGDAIDTSAELGLESSWPRWIVGRSPGLEALIDVNTGLETQLLRLPGINLPKARAIVAARPIGDLAELRKVRGISSKLAVSLRELVAF